MGLKNSLNKLILKIYIWKYFIVLILKTTMAYFIKCAIMFINKNRKEVVTEKTIIL